MNTQLKKGLLEICVLTLLKKEDSNGYKLVKDVSSCIAISESTLYPILRHLETADCLTIYTKEHNGRLQKYYRIASKGRFWIEKLLPKTEVDKVVNYYSETIEDRMTEETLMKAVTGGDAIYLKNDTGGIEGTVKGSLEDYRVKSYVSMGGNNLPKEKMNERKMLNVETSSIVAICK